MRWSKRATLPKPFDREGAVKRWKEYVESVEHAKPIDGKRPYPSGIDCAWLASDARGQLGVFITAGRAPIPILALLEGAVPILDVGDRLDRLPKTSTARLLPKTYDARLLVKIPPPDPDLDVAERGLFVFDWTDIHKTIAESVGKYEAVAVPTRPITVAVLTPETELQDAAVPLPVTDIATTPYIDVRALVDCVDGPAE